MLVVIWIGQFGFKAKMEYEAEESLPVDTLMYVTMTDSDIFLHPDIQYRKVGQPKRHWTREVYYSDVDSVAVCNWNTLTDKEKLDALMNAFIIEIPDSEWNKNTDKENLMLLLFNTFIEWEYKDY